MFVSGRIHRPNRYHGGQIIFGNGTSVRVFRETVVDREDSGNPTVRVVEYRLQAVHGWAHTLFRWFSFRWFSVVATPLFAGSAGFVSKLWLADDRNGLYRGIYEWDSIEHAESYADIFRSIVSPLATPDSVAYHIVPDKSRPEFLAECECLTSAAPSALSAWWRPA